MMPRASCACLIILSLFYPMLESRAGPATQEDKDIAEIGDWVQILLPLSGYLGTWINDDTEGAYQLTKVLMGAGASAHIVKAAAARLRPDAADDRSFPSGHTTAAYAGAEFVRVRYGNAWGIPAHVAAAFVGYSRIRASKHFRDDVLAGAANGMLWNWFFTSPFGETIDVRPVAYDDGYGFEVQYNFDNEIRVGRHFTDRRRYDFTLEFGPVSQDRDLFASPPMTGSVIDLATAESEFDVTSRVTFRHYFRDRHEWEGHLAPMELSEFDPAGTVTSPVDFAGINFVPTADSNFQTRYNLLDLRLVYRYELLRTEHWSLKAGAGLQRTTTYLEITQFRGSPKDNDVIDLATAESNDVNVILSGRLEYRINPRWNVRYEVDGFGSGGDSFLNTALLFDWQAAPGWDLGFGARLIRQDIANSTLSNDIRVSDLVLRVTHGFF